MNNGIKTKNSFIIKIYKENGYRVNITHPAFKGRIRIRIGLENGEDHEYFTLHLKVDLEKHFSTKKVKKEAVKEFVKNYIDMYFNNTISIFDYFDDFISEKENTFNKNTNRYIGKPAIQIYKRSKFYFQNYLKSRRIKPHPDVMEKSTLDNYFYTLKGAHNYRVKLHNKIKEFLKYLETRGFNIHPSYKNSSFNERYDNQEPNENDIALTRRQLKMLLEFRKKINSDNFKLPEYKKAKTLKPELQEFQQNNKLKNLRLTLDCFLFMCATGQYHSDITKSKLNIKKTRNNTLHCSYRRAKNGSKAIAISLENKDFFIAKDLLKQYQIKNNENFPYNLTLKTFDKHIKEISKLAGLNISIGSKMGRKTFATRLYYDYELDIKYIQKLLGHKSIKETYKYLRIEDDDIADEIADKLYL